MKKIGIMGALPEEVEQVAAALEGRLCEAYASIDYYTGTYAGMQVVVCCAGMGKANAASTTQVLITRYEVDAIIFSGIAGNMCDEIGIGDIVVGETLCYHDSEEPMLRQSAPFTNLYTADKTLVNMVSAACKAIGIKYIVGKIATGDQFIGDTDTKHHIQEAYQPHCVEMEGAAVAQVAMRNGVPFVVVRAMSDNSDRQVGELAEFDIEKYVTDASNIVLHALVLLAGKPAK